MAALRVLALLRSAGLAKLIPPLSSVEYAVCPLAMDVWTSPSPSSCEIRRPSLDKYRSSSAIQLCTRGLKSFPSSLRASGSSPTFDPPGASFSLTGDLEPQCYHVLGDLDPISAEFVRSLGDGFDLGNLESEEMSPAFAKLARFVVETFDSDHFEVFIHHWLLMCAPSGSTEEGPGSNGPGDQESNPSDEGQNPGDDSDQKGSEDQGKSKDKKDHRIECDCARFINGSSCEKKCCHDLKFELQKQLYDVNKVKEVLRNQKVTNDTKGDLLDQEILQVREEMKDLQMLKRLGELLHTDIEARKLSGENKESSHEEQKKDSNQQQKKDEQKKDSHQEEEEQKKDSHQEEKNWKKWKMSLTPRGILALGVLKRKFPKTPREVLTLHGEYSAYVNVLYFIALCYLVASQEELTGLFTQLKIMTLYSHHKKKAKFLNDYKEHKRLANEWWAERQKELSDSGES